MFTVSSSPYNSQASQLYGGWAPTTAQGDFNDEGAASATLLAAWKNNPARFLRDSKWANMAMKYSPYPADYALAKLIKANQKGLLKEYRQTPAFKSGYRDALKIFRSPVKRTPLSAAKRANVWATFSPIPDDKLTDRQKAWLALASAGPYAAQPAVPPALEMPARALAALTSGDYLDTAAYKAQRAALRNQVARRFGLTEEMDEPVDFFQ